MISRTVILFLIVAVASGHTIQRPKSHHQMVLTPALSGCPPTFEPAPIICRFMQPGQFHYKPQLIAPSTYIPPIVVKKCDQPKLEIDFAPVKPIIITQTPVLPPITIQKFPVPVIVQKSTPVPIEPCETAFVPDVPAINTFVAPAPPPIKLPALPVGPPEPCLNDDIIPAFQKPMVVPQAPKLPPFVMPAIPATVQVPVVEPCLEDRVIPIAPIPEYTPPPMPLPIVVKIVPEMPIVKIPARPEFPLLKMPVLPEIKAQPEPCFHEVVPEIPQPPELPTRGMAEVPTRLTLTMAEPCLEDNQIPDVDIPKHISPLAPEYIPFPATRSPAVREPCEPTELPPLTMPALPEIVAQPEAKYIEIVAPKMNYKPLVVPHAAELPAFMLPQPVGVDSHIVSPCPEDEVAVAIPEYFHRSPVAIPKYPAYLMKKPEDPCIIGEVPLMVPQFPKFPEPIAAAGRAIVDLCEPFAKPGMKVAELPPYFVRHASHIRTLPLDYNFFPAPYLRHL